jgi:hypothetical protein
MAFGETRELIDLALAQIGRGSHFGQRREPGFDHLQIDRTREPHGLFQPRRGGALARVDARGRNLHGAAAQIRSHHHRTAGRVAFLRRTQPVV